MLWTQTSGEAGVDCGGVCPQQHCERGCTEPAAKNYDPAAAVNDYTCVFDSVACGDPVAQNFNHSEGGASSMGFRYPPGACAFGDCAALTNALAGTLPVTHQPTPCRRSGCVVYAY